MYKLVLTFSCFIILVTPAYSITFINISKDQTWVDIEYESPYIDLAAGTTKNLNVSDLNIKSIRWQKGQFATKLNPYGPGNPYTYCDFKKPLKPTDDVTFTYGDWSNLCRTSTSK